MIMPEAKVFDGKNWITIQDAPITSSRSPVAPSPDGDGKIFIALPSFRGTSTSFWLWSNY
jgi:hypothetical protein